MILICYNKNRKKPPQNRVNKIENRFLIKYCLIFIANFTDIDKLTSVQLPSFFYIDLEKESRNHTKKQWYYYVRVFLF